MKLRWTALVSVLFAIVLASPAVAQQFPAIGHVTIIVYDVDNNSETIAELEPGGTVTIHPGQKARLRMRIAATKNAPRKRYPSATFAPARPLKTIRPIKLDEAVGSYTFVGQNQGNGGGAQAISYEITDTSYRIPNSLRMGTVFVKLQAKETKPSRPTNRPGNRPGGRPDPPGASDEKGVTLYSDVRFRGRAERFVEADSNLRDNRIGNDRASSIRVDRGCVARLFEHVNFSGEYDEVRFDLGDFGSLRIQNDSVSSIQVECDD